MKHFLLIFLAIISLVIPLKAENSVLKKAELRVLDIGNSYTNDATDLLPLIAKASKADLGTMCLYRCFRGGGSFKNWVDIYNDNDNANTYSISKVVGDLPANVQTGTGEKGDGKLFRDVLSIENWDLIIIHQVSTYAPYYSLWNNKNASGYLDELISIIKEHQPNAKLGFLLVHSYWSEYVYNSEKSSFERWQLIANSTKSFCEDYNVDFVIPYGTAIQNLRASSLNNEYDLTRDGTHCEYGLAQYTAACCYYESLIAPRSGISVLGNSARIDVSNKITTYPNINVTDENAIVAQEAAYLAVKDMYHCQNPEFYIFKLTYEVDGAKYKSMKMASEMTISPEPEPAKEGYTFSGWSDIPSTMPANDLSITGTFSINKYKLIYKVDGTEYKSYEVEYGATITPDAAPTKEGHTFSGWSEIPETMPAEDMIITGSFNINKYKLVYYVDGADYKTYEVEYGSTITPDAAPTKEGYTFSGWSEIPKTMPAKDVSITGSFTQVDYEIEGIKYEISDNELSIIKADETSGEVEISSTIVINDKTYTVTSIADGAFMNNTKMTSVTIPNSITSIGDNAFNGCIKLSVISIGSAVATIGSNAFADIKPVATTRGDDGLKISCYALSVPTTAADAFENTPIDYATLLVDDNFVSSYKSTAPWSGFGTIMGFNEATGIKSIRIDSQKAIIYDMGGNRIDQPQRGVNIIRTNDGRTRKVVVGFMR